MNLLHLIYSDYKKYKKYGGNFLTIVFFTQGFWAIFQYRIAHSIYRLPIPFLKKILKFFCFIWKKVIEMMMAANDFRPGEEMPETVPLDESHPFLNVKDREVVEGGSGGEDGEDCVTSDYMLGIDTGGTYTDAVIYSEEHGIVAKAKSLTTRHDLSIGISGALESVLAESAIDPSAIRLVSLSTTLATNALVEGQGGRAGLIMIGFGPEDLKRDGLADALEQNKENFSAFDFLVQSHEIEIGHHTQIALGRYCRVDAIGTVERQPG